MGAAVKIRVNTRGYETHTKTKCPPIPISACFVSSTLSILVISRADNSNKRA